MRTLDSPSQAAAFNANELVDAKPMRWRNVARLGIAAIAFALLDVAESITDVAAAIQAREDRSDG